MKLADAFARIFDAKTARVLAVLLELAKKCCQGDAAACVSLGYIFHRYSPHRKLNEIFARKGIGFRFPENIRSSQEFALWLLELENVDFGDDAVNATVREFLNPSPRRR